MKKCKYCGSEFPEEDFEVANTVKGVVYRRHKCKACKQKTQNQRRRKNANWLRDYKKTLSCVDCGMDDYRCIVFHHIGNKCANVSELAGYSVKKMKEELKNTVPICVNCHRIRHWEEDRDVA